MFRTTRRKSDICLEISQSLEHETRSCQLLRKIVNEYDVHLTDEELSFVETCIHPTKDDVERSKKAFLLQVVSNPITGIDVDKFDYLKRDAHNLGLDSSFDASRIMQDARVIKGQQLAYSLKSQSTIHRCSKSATIC